MIKCHCFTNIDKFKREEWPVTFPVVPSVGHYVKSREGVTLKIVQLTWCEYFDEVCLNIELHTADGTVPR